MILSAIISAVILGEAFYIFFLKQKLEYLYQLKNRDTLEQNKEFEIPKIEDIVSTPN